MYLDYLTTAALADELRSRLPGARVQDVLQADALTVQLELYAGRRWYLTLTADGRREGLRLSEAKGRRGEGPPTPLLLALRARVAGARLAEVAQPAFERLLDFRFDAGTPAPARLVAELMGRLANVILLDENGLVVAAARWVTPAMTSARVILPGRPYAPPPAPAKRVPAEVGPADVDRWRAAEPAVPVEALLVRHVRGLSPLAAREILARARRAPDPVASSEIVGQLAALFDLPVSRAWTPSIARAAGGSVVAYAPYLLTHLSGCEPMPTISAALEAFEQATVGTDAYREARAAVAAELAEVQERLQRRSRALARERDREPDVGELRLCGDLILAYQSTIQPGQTVLEAPFDPDAPPRRIRLDPRLTAVENAQAYYRRHRRARRAAEELPARLATAAAALATLEQLQLDLELAEDRPAIDAVHDALVAAGYLKVSARRRAVGPAGPLRLVSIDGFTLLVGRNSLQNEVVTFQRAGRNDLWLHAHGLPGAHVVIRSSGRAVPEATLREAAALAAYFSRGRHEAQVAVDVTAVRHVRRLRGGGPGMVSIQQARTVTVAPRAPGAPEGGPDFRA